MLQELTAYYFQQAITLANNHKITKALAYIEKTTTLNKDNWNAWNFQGLCLYQLGEFSKARQVWMKSVKINPESNSAVRYLQDMEGADFINLCKGYNTALTFIKDGNYKAAIKILNGKEFTSYPVVTVLNLIGLCYYEEGKMLRALGVWQKSFEIDSSHKDTLTYIEDAIKKLDERPWFLRWFGK